MPTYTVNQVKRYRHLSCPMRPSRRCLGSQHHSGSLTAVSADYTSCETTCVCAKGLPRNALLSPDLKMPVCCRVLSRVVEDGPTSVSQFVVRPQEIILLARAHYVSTTSYLSATGFHLLGHRVSEIVQPLEVDHMTCYPSLLPSLFSQKSDCLLSPGQPK